MAGGNTCLPPASESGFFSVFPQRVVAFPRQKNDRKVAQQLSALLRGTISRELAILTLDRGVRAKHTISWESAEDLVQFVGDFLLRFRL